MNNSSNKNIRTFSVGGSKINQDDHNNSDSWRKLDVILRTLEANNACLNRIEEKLEMNASECTEECNAMSNKILDVHAKLEENVETV